MRRRDHRPGDEQRGDGLVGLEHLEDDDSDSKPQHLPRYLPNLLLGGHIAHVVADREVLLHHAERGLAHAFAHRLGKRACPCKHEEVLRVERGGDLQRDSHRVHQLPKHPPLARLLVKVARQPAAHKQPPHRAHAVLDNPLDTGGGGGCARHARAHAHRLQHARRGQRELRPPRDVRRHRHELVREVVGRHAVRVVLRDKQGSGAVQHAAPSGLDRRLAPARLQLLPLARLAAGPQTPAPVRAAVHLPHLRLRRRRLRAAAAAARVRRHRPPQAALGDGELQRGPWRAWRGGHRPEARLAIPEPLTRHAERATGALLARQGRGDSHSARR
mmetsp:Transcript_1380/g.3225  ORF Transcript_1380/g.3225 Transcript_1380/m.3225 type:complete len:330 (-) Transcript_1380:408-1397(-)